MISALYGQILSVPDERRKMYSDVARFWALCTARARVLPGTAAKRPGQRMAAPSASRFGDAFARIKFILT